MTAAAPAASGYQLLPALTSDEYAALRESIRERGVLVAVEVDENGVTLDGHHRKRIADELGVDYPVMVREGMTEAEKLEHVFELNVARRNMSGHDRSIVIALCRQRGMSLRAIGRALGVAHTTVMRNGTGASAPPEIHADDEPEATAEWNPLPPAKTRATRVAELIDEGRSGQAIANELGIDRSTVSRIAAGQTAGLGVGAPVEWPATRAFIRGLNGFAVAEPRRVAASVPERSRRTVAKRLRAVGTFLGSIALELERG